MVFRIFTCLELLWQAFEHFPIAPPSFVLSPASKPSYFHKMTFMFKEKDANITNTNAHILRYSDSVPETPLPPLPALGFFQATLWKIQSMPLYATSLFVFWTDKFRKYTENRAFLSRNWNIAHIYAELLSA